MFLGKCADTHVNGPDYIMNHVIIINYFATLSLSKLHFACMDKYFILLRSHSNEIVIAVFIACVYLHVRPRISIS